MIKTISIAIICLLGIAATSFGAANRNFTLTNVTASVGVNAREGKLIVYGNWSENVNQAVFLVLGDASDGVAKVRYATVLAAMAAGKNIYISYWTNNTATNYEAYIDDVSEIWTLKNVN